jgi:hypothetical protein
MSHERSCSPVPPDFAPGSFPDATIDAFKKDLDRTLIRENLKLTPEQRLRKLQDFVAFAAMLREQGRQVQR